MRGFLNHLKTYVIRGFWAVIPLALSIFVLRLIYVSIDQRVMNAIASFLGFRLPGLGLLLLVLVLYLLGLIASNMLGRHILNWIERLMDRIPFIRTTYRVGRQLATTFTVPEREVFKRAILVEYLKPGMWTVGFVTGSLRDLDQGGNFLKVYIPTPPNPTSGTMVLVRESETRDPGWTVDEAMKIVISAGIIGPGEMGARAKPVGGGQGQISPGEVPL